MLEHLPRDQDVDSLGVPAAVLLERGDRGWQASLLPPWDVVGADIDALDPVAPCPRHLEEKTFGAAYLEQPFGAAPSELLGPEGEHKPRVGGVACTQLTSPRVMIC